MIDQINLVLIIAIITAGVVSITTLILKFIEKRKENELHTEDTLFLIGDIVGIVVNTVKQFIETKNVKKEDFETKDEYIEFIIKNINSSVKSILEDLGIYETCKIIFKEDIDDMLRYIIKNNDYILGIEDKDWEK